MAKKKRNPFDGGSNAAGSNPSQSAQAAAGGINNQANSVSAKSAGVLTASGSIGKLLAKLPPLPAELGRGDWTVIILSMMLFFTPTLGVPHELMIQDTLKSIIVAFMSLGALLLVFWSQRNRRDGLRWHFVMWLPILLCAYAVGSMFWSHTFLAGVEAIRWFLFAVIVWLVLNSVSRERFPILAWGIHLGALGVALLGASQFWFDVRIIPQGPNPAATFVNRNFAAEFMACTVAFSAYLVFIEKRTAVLAFLAGTSAFHIVFLMMCGTRAAYLGAGASLVFIVVTAFVFHKKFAFKSWNSAQRITVLGVFLATLLGLGLIKSGNPGAEFKDVNSFQRGLSRAATIGNAAVGNGDATLGVRMVMWKATVNMIQKRPLSGVGAGAWEVDVPLYQAEGSQLETDYYAHNEFLQLLGEYGLVGWFFLLSMTAYLLYAAWRTVRNKTEEGMNEGPLRAVALCSLLALMVVSNIGFAWRLAATGAMFAVCMGVLAASDARQGIRGIFAAVRLPFSPGVAQTGAVLTMLCLALTTYITQQAAEAEAKIVNSVKLALQITQSGNPSSPKHDKTKLQMMNTLREGVAITPHYRKITPMVGDELAKWGDWKNATWVWENVVSSRPYVVAMMTNIARGHLVLSNMDKVKEYLDRCKKIQPKAISVRSLEVVYLSRTNQEPEALKLTRQYIAENTVDQDLLNAGYILGVRSSDFPFAIAALEKRNEIFPAQKVDGLIKIANIYVSYIQDEPKAIAIYKAAYEASGKAAGVLAQIPPAYQDKL